MTIDRLRCPRLDGEESDGAIWISCKCLILVDPTFEATGCSHISMAEVS